MPQLENSNKEMLPLNTKEQYEIEKIHQGALSTQSVSFLNNHTAMYQLTNTKIDQLVKEDIMVTPVPIKLQTLLNLI